MDIDLDDELAGTLGLPDYWARLNTNNVKAIARRWLGTVGQKMRKDDAILAMSEVLDNPAQLKRVVAGFKPLEQAGLALLARNGGRMPMIAFAPALWALGYPAATRTSHYPFGAYGYTSSNLMYAALNDLEDAGLVGGAYLQHPETTSERIYSDRRALQLHAYSDQRLLRAITGPGPRVLELTPLPDQSGGTFRRPAEVSLRLLELVEALRRISPYPVTAKGRPTKPMLRKLGKALGWEGTARQDDQLPSETSTEFFYRVLVALSLVDREEGTAAIAARADTILQLPFPTQAHNWAVAYGELLGWIECEVPGMWLYGEDLYAANVLNGMRGALLVALSALPSAESWYSISSLSEALWNRMAGKFSLVTPPPVYAPWGATEAQKSEIELKRANAVRESWVKNEGTWITHTLAAPLFQLGLVEIGTREPGKGLPDRFRLTEAGRAAFDYPGHAAESASVEANPAPGMLRWVVQPNFDVIAYLDQMSPAALAFLARVAERKPSDGGVGIYRLTRESIYAALESGLTLPSLLQQLEEGARQPLPATLQRALSDWAARRERISLHRLADLLEYPDAQARDEALSRQPALGTPLGSQFILVSGNAPKAALASAAVVDYLLPPIPCLHVEETGRITVDATRSDFLVRGELSNWADQQGQDRNHWRISAASVARAVQGGWSSEKILDALQARSSAELPPLLVVGLRSWCRKRQGRPGAGLAKELILQFAEPEVAEAVAGSVLFSPHLRARLGDRTFLVTAASLKPLRALLEEFGLSPESDLSIFGENTPKSSA